MDLLHLDIELDNVAEVFGHGAGKMVKSSRNLISEIYLRSIEGLCFWCMIYLSLAVQEYQSENSTIDTASSMSKPLNCPAMVILA